MEQKISNSCYISGLFDNQESGLIAKVKGIQGVGDSNVPYLKKRVILEIGVYNPNYGDERICKCGHPYYRHFDSYDNMSPVGCKYCSCHKFREKK